MVLAGWLLFAWCWRVVTADHPSIGQLSDLLIGALVVVPVFTVSWVMHNLGIHRRKGPRRSVPAVEQRYERDYNGRLIHADWAALASVQRIDIVIDGDSKRFVVVAAGGAGRSGPTGPGDRPDVLGPAGGAGTSDEPATPAAGLSPRTASAS